MKKSILILLAFIMISACSGGGSGSSDRDVQIAESYEGMEESGIIGTKESVAFDMDEAGESGSSEPKVVSDSNRKVVYTSDITLETDNFDHLFLFIEKEVGKVGGYIVESMLHNEQGEEGKSGYVTVRIPQKEFHPFMEVVEKGSTRVIDRVISGQDVTEEFVDLESRLKSKKQVEERLLEFMEDAEKTEDLLKISDDLARVQEEIETIVGRLKYLKDKTDFATVTIHIQEENVKLTSMNEGELNTWDEAKKQWMRSINFILTAFSGMFVFFVGNFPLFLLGLIFIGIGFIIWRKVRRKRRNEDDLQ